MLNCQACNEGQHHRCAYPTWDCDCCGPRKRRETPAAEILRRAGLRETDATRAKAAQVWAEIRRHPDGDDATRDQLLNAAADFTARARAVLTMDKIAIQNRLVHQLPGTRQYIADFLRFLRRKGEPGTAREIMAEVCRIGYPVKPEGAPPACAYCGDPAPEGAELCAECAARNVPDKGGDE
jgi:hypothetical protein